MRTSGLSAWAEWQSRHPDKRILQRDELPKGVVVSTIFLGLDQNWGRPPPLLWETVILGGPHDQYQERYATAEEARDGHAEALKLATVTPLKNPR